MEWSRLWKNPDGTNIKLPTHLFLYITLVFGLAFALPPQLFGMAALELFKFSTVNNIGFYWGLALLLTTVLNVVMMVTHSKLLGSITGVLGFCCWVYAGFAYIMIGLPFGFLVAALPNIAFWAWYALQVSQWKRYITENTNF